MTSQPAQPDSLAPANQPVAPAQQSPAAATTAVELAKKKNSTLLYVVIGLVAALIVVGGGAALLFLPKSPPVQMIKAAAVPPDRGTAPPLPAYQLEQAKPTSRSVAAEEEHLEKITAAAKRLQARLLVGAGEATAPREFIVRGGGAGDSAKLELPNHERWEIQFPPGLTIEAYARQLDFFQMELGVIGGSQQVSYLSELSNPKPKVRVAAGNTDARLYLIWNRGPMREADEILVGRAGLSIEGKVLAHFCPPALEADMLRVEAEQAKANNFTQVRRTVFSFQPGAGDGFRLAVVEQKGD
ncbi:hypothetical protein [Anatilimnocola floriformis]|uniref:hypothetical protein n=1 Tax=Anatilimnocola floriformis TaxID=2948575 RepID=UPI0020C46347|nr:hypothetical protein [Anatilimnocola floriformis]